MLLKNYLSSLFCNCLILLSLPAKLAYGACSANQFECSNGSCISMFTVCDGVRNCPDGADETGVRCVAQRQMCTKPYFTCTYGPCVIGTAACNGVNECADGSDETLLRCGNEDDVREFNRKLQGNCQANEMKCPLGNCIDKSRHMCDGKDDCGDGFDESVSLCGHLECPGYSFQCASGSCISSQLICNGHADCFDGTDEAPLLCNTTGEPQLVTTFRPPIPQEGCPLPQNDEQPILKNKQGIQLTPPITRGRVMFSCRKGFFLVGSTESVCVNKKWSVPAVPTCMKFCPTLLDSKKDQLHGYSTTPTCVFKGQKTNCANRYHPPGTVVKFVCATGFETRKTTLPDITCLHSGDWSRDRERCDQVCGQIATPTTQFSANGHPINNTVVPWHMGLYANHDELEYKFTCGGSMLTPDVIITAAHCVFNDATRVAYDPKTFMVVAAKLYRDYNRQTDLEVRQSVEKIIVAPGYKGREDNYNRDLALLVLKDPFELSNVIRPICVHFSQFAEREAINDNVEGRFAAWNYKDDRNLQIVLALSKMNSACKEYQHDISGDKFCMFTTGESLACHGDSGGGFTAERLYSRDTKRHFLHGLISGAPNAGECAHSVTTLTNIEYFSDLITNAIRDSEDNKS